MQGQATPALPQNLSADEKRKATAAATDKRKSLPAKPQLGLGKAKDTKAQQLRRSLAPPPASKTGMHLLI